MDIAEKAAEALMAEGRYLEAAHAFSQIDVARFSEATEKMERLLLICELFLDGEDFARAENFCVAAAALGCAEKRLKLRLSLSQARLLDSKFKFPDACVKYLSVADDFEVGEDDRKNVFEMAIACFVLMPVGALRNKLAKRFLASNLLQLLPQSVSQLIGTISAFEVVEKAETFAPVLRLAPHHLAMHANGVSVFRNAMIEYNLHALSLKNLEISLGQVSDVLGVDEEFIFNLIIKGKLKARISQKSASLIFEKSQVCGSAKILDFCDRLTRLAEKV